MQVFASICKYCSKDVSAKWGRKNKHKYYGYDIKRKYGITIEGYERQLNIQNNLCAICSRDVKTLKKKLAVDHNHKTNKNRGLLCIRCNQGIGYFSDNPDLLEKAITYLNKYD